MEDMLIVGYTDEILSQVFNILYLLKQDIKLRESKEMKSPKSMLIKITIQISVTLVIFMLSFDELLMSSTALNLVSYLENVC